MRRFPAILTLALFLAPAGLAAQRGPVTQSMKGLHEIPKGFILATAEMLSDDMYGFQPTEDVRTAGQILAHIAGAQYNFCSVAAGEASPTSEQFEQTRTTKSQIIDALEQGFAYCDQVYASMSDERGTEMRSLFGNDLAATAVFAFNTAHNYEHYGNLVTYMRLNGITPPSSM